MIIVEINWATIPLTPFKLSSLRSKMHDLVMLVFNGLHFSFIRVKEGHIAKWAIRLFHVNLFEFNIDGYFAKTIRLLEAGETTSGTTKNFSHRYNKYFFYLSCPSFKYIAQQQTLLFRFALFADKLGCLTRTNRHLKFWINFGYICGWLFNNHINSVSITNNWMES